MRSALVTLLLAVVLCALVVWVRPVAAPPAPDTAAGQTLYAKDCALCHGDTGRGDGASAAAFATKPADFTDGRLLNPLPDEFLFSVIKHGGPAEGLSPGMPPFAGHLSEAQIRQVMAHVRSLARPAFRPGDAGPPVTRPITPTQPIFFNHVVHAGSYGIPCQYCHADARRSDYAGLPSVDRCMGCHKIIGAQDNPEIGRIHGYASRGEAIPWVRVFKVPEFTYFPHKPHIRAELACQTCHGPVERMRVVGTDRGPNLVNDLQRAIGLNPPPPVLSMGWCLECHRSENATRGRHAPLDCVTCHH